MKELLQEIDRTLFRKVIQR